MKSSMKGSLLRRPFLLPAAISLAMVPRSSDAWAQSGSATDEIIGDCEQSTAEAYLNGNNVLARIPINGALFYRGEPHVYRVPRFSNSNAIFSSSIIVGGLIDDQVHIAATRYQRWEFWAGPLDDDGVPPEDCSEFDRMYKIRRVDIEEYNETGYATGDLLEWPTGLGAPTVDANGVRIDVSHLPYLERLERVIDLNAGERPEILGDLALWWIINDRGNVHESTDSPSLGIEVHGFAYVMSSSAAALNNATLYRFTVVNRNSKAIKKTYFGVFVDPDLGDAGDDYLGSDSLRNTAYVYNADDMDSGGEGYGRAPPAVGFRILKGARADDDGFDNDRDGLIDEWDERPGMSHFLYYNNGGGPNEAPFIGNDWYNYLRSIWKNGNPVLYGGDGFESNVTQRHANYMYPGDPVTGEYWSELNTDGQGRSNTPADRRFILSSGPFDLQPEEAKEVDFAVVFGRGTDNLDSITEMRYASDVVQSSFDVGFANYPRGIHPERTVLPVSPADGASEQSTSLELVWDWIPGVDGYQVVLSSLGGDREIDAATTSTTVTGLEPNKLYRWRVRGISVYGETRFSEWRSFTTTSATDQRFPMNIRVVQNSDGVLDPPDLASYARHGTDSPYHPCPEQPILFCYQPTRGYQQSSSSAIWTVGYASATGTYTSILNGLFLSGPAYEGIPGSEYELRWVGFGQGGMGYDPGLGGSWIDVGFELWNIGVATPDDSSDDYRMIPFVQMDQGGSQGASQTVFTIGGDHTGYSGDDDPFSNYISWHDPPDRSPGNSGYQAFLTGAAKPGNEVIRDMVLVQIDGGSVPPYEVDFPEPGTVFRITSRRTIAPAPASPGNDTQIAPGVVRFFWNGSEDTYQFQLSRTPEFTKPDYSVPAATPGISIPVAPAERYYWRVQGSAGGWSSVWSFSTLDVPGAGKDDAAVTAIHNFPNPFGDATTIRFYVREASRIQIDVRDVLGRHVMSVLDDYLEIGPHFVPVDGGPLASGLYLYTIRSPGFVTTQPMMVAH